MYQVLVTAEGEFVNIFTGLKNEREAKYFAESVIQQMTDKIEFPSADLDYTLIEVSTKTPEEQFKEQMLRIEKQNEEFAEELRLRQARIAKQQGR